MEGHSCFLCTLALYCYIDPCFLTGAVPVEPTPAALLEVESEESKREKLKGFSLWTLCTGIVYGLQPDALFVIIPALALPTKLAAAA